MHSRYRNITVGISTRNNSEKICIYIDISAIENVTSALLPPQMPQKVNRELHILKHQDRDAASFKGNSTQSLLGSKKPHSQLNLYPHILLSS